jgi:transposase-like protein
MQYERHSEKFKEAILAKLFSTNMSVLAFSKQEGINSGTLYNWVKRFKQAGSGLPKPTIADKWSAEEKFAVVAETLAFTEIELSEYCRTKGLYPEQVKSWKQACIAGNTHSKRGRPATSAEQKADKKRIKSLERELNRKEKALAETAALLVLRKKFNAYWEGKEED